MRYVIFGAGAVGGVVGGLLHRAGVEVTLVARGEHLRAIQNVGLSLDTPDGVLTLDVPAVEDASQVAWTEDTVVLLSVKGQQTEAALEDLAAYAPAGTPSSPCRTASRTSRGSCDGSPTPTPSTSSSPPPS